MLRTIYRGFPLSRTFLKARTTRLFSGEQRVEQLVKEKPLETKETQLLPVQESQVAPKEDIHHTPIMLKKDGEAEAKLHWVPPIKPKEKTKSIMGDDGGPDDFIYHLPPPPRFNLNSTIPEHVAFEKRTFEILDEHLPPNDIFRIPVACNKPWFTITLWSYCAVVAACVILFGKWDKLNEGNPHCFQGIQTWARAFWAKVWFVDEETEAELVLERIRGAQEKMSHK